MGCHLKKTQTVNAVIAGTSSDVALDCKGGPSRWFVHSQRFRVSFQKKLLMFWLAILLSQSKGLVSERRTAGVKTCFVLATLLMLGCQPESTTKSNATRPTAVPPSGVRTGPAATPPPAAIESAIQSAIDRGEFKSAESMVVSAMLAVPTDPRLHGLLGDLRNSQQAYDAALAAYGDAIELLESDADSDATVASAKASGTLRSEMLTSLRTKVAQVFMAQGRPYDAVTQMQTVVTKNPDHADSRKDLIGLLSWTGQQAKATPHLQWLVQRGLGDVSQLGLLANLSRSQASAELCKQALAKVPSDHRPHYGLAMTEVSTANWASISDRCERVLRTHPDFVPALVLATRAAVERHDEEMLSRIADQDKPASYFDQSRAWTAWGLWAEQKKDLPRATAALLKSISIQPDDGETLSALTRVLASSGNMEASKIVADRLTTVNFLNETIDGLASWKNNSQAEAVKMSDALLRLGRPWEAIGWLREASKMFGQPVDDLRSRYAAQHAELTGSTPWQIPSFTIEQQLKNTPVDLLSWRPEANDQAIATLLSVSNRTDSLAHVGRQDRGSIMSGEKSLIDEYRLVDEAFVRGLDHVCRVMPDGKPVEGGLWIWQSSVGGAGVIDFDLDGHSDLVLTAADGDPGKRNSTANSLFRNRGGNFVDVSAVSGLADVGCTQGVGVGDYNADGFADCIIANIGGNRLYRNNGDGTFTDVTAECLTETDRGSSNRWTSSIAMADVNSDGIGDFVEVNYCAGQSPYTQRCFVKDGSRHRSCQPLVFPAEPDRVWLGSGDGTLSPAIGDRFKTTSPGRGLGLVVGQFDALPGLDIFVANDMTANHFWTASDRPGDQPIDRWEEQAIIRGLASDSRSQPQASMGIAAADVDGDLDIDFSLTHFTNEYNTLYRQITPGFFVDATVSAGLADATRPMLGFGTQFADLNVDGRPELIVANGNVDDFSHQGDGFRMPLQLFAPENEGRWRLVDGKQIGPGFGDDVLARAVANLDVDRDGRVDFVVSHLSEPTRLWINRTGPMKRSLSIRLVGRDCDRDAIGTTVMVTSADGTAIGQRMSGNGYQCSSEPLIRFAIPTATTVIDATTAGSTVKALVDWPDGSRQTVSLSIPAESGSQNETRSAGEWLIVQGESVAFELR